MGQQPQVASRRPEPMRRDEFQLFYPMTTRLNDMDGYRHMNNAVFVEYFDSAVNRAMIERGVLDMGQGGSIGLVVQGSYDYFAPVSYPEPVDVAVRVARLGTSSVVWEFAMFRADEYSAVAQGRFTHVHVGRIDRRPCHLPADRRDALASLVIME